MASTGEELRNWIKSRGLTQAVFAEAIGVNVGTLNHLLSGKREPSEAQITAIREATEGAISEWRREPGPSGPVVLGTTQEELRRSLANLTRASQGAQTPPHLAALEGKRLSVLRELRRLEESKGIEEHPDFEGLVEDLISAVLGELGPRAPEGLEGRIADRLEALQAARAVGASRRRAAA